MIIGYEKTCSENKSNPGAQPKWLSASEMRWSECPKALWPWLKIDASMTQHMREKAAVSFDVYVVFHEWSTPFLDEAECLKLNEDEKTIVREVILKLDEKPCIYARSVFPETVLKGEGREFVELGNKPLGELLFADKKLKRSAFEYAQMKAESYYVQQIKKELECHDNLASLWGRRSVFEIHSGSLLLTEIFLPQIYDVY